MLKWFNQLDQILRGDATKTSKLQDGQFKIQLKGLLFLLLLLSACYGACMGSFNLLHPHEEDFIITTSDNWMQTFASAIKFPLLFLLTLLITFPSLYVFNAIVGSRLNLLSVLRLLVASSAVMIAVVASLGPILVFFSLSTKSYSFMLLLNVAICFVSGLLGLAFLLRTLHRLMTSQVDLIIPLADSEQAFATQQATADNMQSPPPLHNQANSKQSNVNLGSIQQIGPTNKRAKAVFNIWIIVFGLVGAQMSWVLRPFIGNPYMPFEWFRNRESNFFIAVFQALTNLFNFN